MANDMAVRARGSAVAAPDSVSDPNSVSDPTLPGNVAAFQLASKGTGVGWGVSLILLRHNLIR
jgi:hypothetical protein